MAACCGSWIITPRRRSVIGCMYSNTSENMLISAAYIANIAFAYKLVNERTFWVSGHTVFNISLWSASCCTASTDLPDPLLPPFSIVHRSRSIFKATSCISTELLYIGSSWLSCLCLSMWRSAQEYVMSSSLFFQQCPAYLVRLTWIVFVMGGKWPYSCCFVGCWYCSQHSCVIAVKLFLHTFS